MINLALMQCPQCFKCYITKIVVRQTLVGGRPTLIFPTEKCNGKITIDETEVECGFEFTKLQVESFDIPMNVDPKALVKKPGVIIP